MHKLFKQIFKEIKSENLLLEWSPFRQHKFFPFRAIQLEHGHVLTFSFQYPAKFTNNISKAWLTFSPEPLLGENKNLLTLWFWIWCCDELSLSGLDIVSPFNEMPESIGPSIDCGRELDPSTCTWKFHSEEKSTEEK